MDFRKAAPPDIPVIRSLAERIWRESYAAMLSTDQIDYMLGWMYGADRIAAEMAAGVVWELAETPDGPVGYCSTTIQDGGVAELNKLYLLPSLQGRGHGQAMLSHVEVMVRDRKCRILRLRVNRTNDRALRAYRRAGFAIVDADVAQIGAGFVMDDYILERRLAIEAPLVKICGLSTPETMAAALDCGADWIGLVFFPKSPRHVTLDQARSLAAQARGRADVVALTVDSDDAALAAIIDAVAPDRLQLHGRETPDRVAAVKTRFGLPILKAVGVSSAADVASAAAYAGAVDRILFDAKPPKDAALPGGNGIAFDWTLLRGAPTPFMVSGGLAPENVGEAIRVSGAEAVDVSSGVEAKPGKKDPARIRAFIKAVRGGDPVS